MECDLIIPISPGEMLDKLTILQLKLENILDEKKIDKILIEKTELQKIWDSSHYSKVDMVKEIEELYKINSILWDTEDRIREKERLKIFDIEFIELARNIYKTNDLRSALKKEINIKSGSILSEEKSYQQY